MWRIFPSSPVKALSRSRVTFLCGRRFAFLAVPPYRYLAQEEEVLKPILDVAVAVKDEGIALAAGVVLISKSMI